MREYIKNHIFFNNSKITKKKFEKIKTKTKKKMKLEFRRKETTHRERERDV